MAEYVVVDKEKLDSDLTIVADSIRAKGGTTEELEFPLGMKEAVESIKTGITKPEQEKTIEITENGTTEVTPDEGKVLSKVTVNVEVESGGGSDKWWDFTVEATSDIANVTELANLFYTYLSDIRPMKEFAIITMQNVDVAPVSTSGTPLISYLYRRGDNGAMECFVTRHRNINSLSTPVVHTSGSGVSVKAGFVFYVKVVTILV